jgi:uncharacterized integral membrane protein (TIGR00698 family)
MSEKSHWTQPIKGIALAGIIGICATQLASIHWFSEHGISPLTLAIVLGILLGNSIYPYLATWASSGVAISRTTILRTGVVLYGFRLTLQDVVHVGVTGVSIDLIMVVSTFLLAVWIGTRLLKMAPSTSMLVGSGSAICGAAAVLATEPVVVGRSEEVSVAVAGVVIFGTISMFLYPLLVPLNHLWMIIPGGAREFGIYIGSTVHEVAQVVAASRQVSMDAAGTAVITKMVRVLMLAPFLVVLAAWLKPREQVTNSGSSQPNMLLAAIKAVPVFAFLFIAVVLLNSLQWIEKPIVDGIIQIDTLLVASAMGALGLSTNIATLAKSGGKPMLLSLILFFWLVLGGAGVNHIVMTYLG